MSTTKKAQIQTTCKNSTHIRNTAGKMHVRQRVILYRQKVKRGGACLWYSLWQATLIKALTCSTRAQTWSGWKVSDHWTSTKIAQKWAQLRLSIISTKTNERWQLFSSKSTQHTTSRSFQSTLQTIRQESGSSRSTTWIMLTLCWTTITHRIVSISHSWETIMA